MWGGRGGVGQERKRYIHMMWLGSAAVLLLAFLLISFFLLLLTSNNEEDKCTQTKSKPKFQSIPHKKTTIEKKTVSQGKILLFLSFGV